MTAKPKSDSLGRDHAILLWEGISADALESAAQPLSTFEGAPRLQPASVSFLTNVLRAASLWLVDTSQSLTLSALSQSAEPGQVTDPDRCVCGYFIVKGSVEEVLGLVSKLEFGFLGEYEMDQHTRELVEAHTTLTLAPLSGASATLIAVWAKMPVEDDPPEMPVEIVLDIITRVHGWTRMLLAQEVLLDTGRINVRYDSWHVESGQRGEGRKSSGRLLGIGRYDTTGPSLLSAYEGLMLASDNEVLESARENHIECAQGPGNCPRTVERVLAHDDPRNSLFA